VRRKLLNRISISEMANGAAPTFLLAFLGDIVALFGQLK
jgi:hypothetical protein